MQQTNQFSHISYECPALIAEVRGSADYSAAEGLIHVFWLPEAFYLQLELNGLPPSEVFGFHIHESLICGEIDGDKPFAQAGGHLNNCGEGAYCAIYPYQAGDLPHIISDANGYAAAQVYIDRANVQTLSGRAVVLHSIPGGGKELVSSGKGPRIACGILAENI